MTAADHIEWALAYIERRYGPGPVYCPGNPYPSIWERIALFGRKNSSGRKVQKPRKVKGRKKPPHRGGDTGKKKGGLFG